MNSEYANNVITDADKLEYLQGYGEVLKVFIGMKDGKPVSKSYHIAPVSIKDIPKLTEKILKFEESAKRMQDSEDQKSGFNKTDAKNAAQMILMGLKKTMPEVSEDEIMENFPFGTMIKASHILISVNDLGTQVDKEGNVKENPIQKLALK